MSAVNDSEILQAARTHYRAAAKIAYPESFALSDRWSHWSRMASDAMEGFTGVAEAIGFAQQKMGFEHRHSVADSIQRWGLYQAALEEDFPDRKLELARISESHLSAPTTVRWYRGRPMSNMFFWHTYEYLSTSRAVPHPRRIVEIGGGYGALARLWLSRSDTLESYWMTDFPEALFFVEIYLRSHFPGVSVHYWNPGDKLSEVEKARHQIVLFPAQCAGELHGLSGDLLVNSGSMQEMPESAILYWSKWIEGSKLQNFWACNYFLQPVQQMRGGSANWMCPRVSADWECLSTRLDPPLVRTQTVRHFREVIYRRLDQRKLSRAQQQFLSDQILASFISRIDLTDTDGVLQLFEAVRLSGRPDACLRLIDVLDNFTDYRPKELVYLCNHLLNDYNLPADKKTRVQAILEDVMKVAREEHAAAIPTKPLF